MTVEFQRLVLRVWNYRVRRFHFPLPLLPEPKTENSGALLPFASKLMSHPPICVLTLLAYTQRIQKEGSGHAKYLIFKKDYSSR